MRIDVIPSINDIRSSQFMHRTAIVIDVLRATSSIVTGLQQGCAGVVPVKTVNQALSYKQAGDLLAGERYCKKIAGFDLGNSPTEFLSSELKHKRIIFTSTNGTRIIEKSCKAENVLAGSFLNATACAKAAVELGRDVLIICAGSQDKFSLEDGLCAGLIAAELELLASQTVCNDFAKAMQWAYIHAAEQIEQTMLESENGTRLTQLGYKDDVVYCARINHTNIVPIMHEHVMTAL